MFHTGADKNDSASKEAFRFLNAIAGSVQRVRVCGAAALDICMVASGATDGYFEPGIYIWDTAAADLVLRRAGGRGEILKSFGGHKIAYLATNGKIHRKISNILNPLI
jgi:myo-inositol-1(or 4)-monophosphatase